MRAYDPWSERNRRLENPSISERRAEAKKELQQRIDAASRPKPKPASERPYIPEKPFFR